MAFLTSIRDIIPRVTDLFSPSSPSPQDPFNPTYADICRTRILLKSLHLPTELVLSILEFAEYWPRILFSTTYTAEHPRPIIASATGGRDAAAALCLRADIFDAPVVTDMCASGENPKIKKVEFIIRSRDQGWTSQGGEGGFATSSWIEVSILRRNPHDSTNFEPPRFEPPHNMGNGVWDDGLRGYHAQVARYGWQLVQRPGEAHHGPQWGEGGYAWYLQGNRVSGDSETYRVVWGREGSVETNEGAGDGQGFLEELRKGDRIVVWARARYPGWQCIVEQLDVTVYVGF
ncbi:ankyrin repeat [Pyrenophora seminiperda CCB06]|uniref:Ankyrin repeat n=1 Tax=Pyrenophora seminiperda CCB06 TaxID=1302712 RepID=A0A3M7M846_9PLEO|nr:ankyrin repeat [Pyrenophora seminiperda CCB06]